MKSRQIDNIEELILDGVDRLLARDGYDEVSVDSLAKEVGLKGRRSIPISDKARPHVVTCRSDRS